MEEVVQPKVYMRTCVALLALLALTWTIAYIDLGPFNLIVRSRWRSQRRS